MLKRKLALKDKIAQREKQKTGIFKIAGLIFMNKILITCPPMARMIEDSNILRHTIQKYRFDVTIPELGVVMSEDELVNMIGNYDGWIFADDPATDRVLKARKKLKGCMRWGVGTDNIDWEAFKNIKFQLKILQVYFGREVADLAMHYITGLSRHTYLIDRAQNNIKDG